ncbi:hypothetical protein [Syntrophomonas curvata]
MANKEFSIQEKLELITKEISKDGTEGCINCDFSEYRNGKRNYCTMHDKIITEYDPPCKDYMEQGSL